MQLWWRCCLVAAVVVLSACGGTTAAEDLADGQTATSEPTAMTAAVAEEPLSESEEADESNYLDTAVTFAEMGQGIVHFTSLVSTQSQTSGPFTVGVVRAGAFTITGDSTGGADYFRVDLKVENVGESAEQFAPTALVLSDGDGTEYQPRNEESERTLGPDFGTAPGETYRGYWLFEALPESVTTLGLGLELGTDAAGSAHSFEYELDLSSEEEGDP